MIVVSFEFDGRKLGRSSKVNVKSPCSPHPLVGVVAVDDAVCEVVPLRDAEDRLTVVLVECTVLEAVKVIDSETVLEFEPLIVGEREKVSDGTGLAVVEIEGEDDVFRELLVVSLLLERTDVVMPDKVEVMDNEESTELAGVMLLEPDVKVLTGDNVDARVVLSECLKGVVGAPESVSDLVVLIEALLL